MGSATLDIQYTEEALDDARSLRKLDQQNVLEAIETHLMHEPTKTSRSRIKRMAQPFWSE